MRKKKGKWVWIRFKGREKKVQNTGEGIGAGWCLGEGGGRWWETVP